MKKLILMTMISISLFSCKKEKNCNCGRVVSKTIVNQTFDRTTYKISLQTNCDSLITKEVSFPKGVSPKNTFCF